MIQNALSPREKAAKRKAATPQTAQPANGLVVSVETAAPASRGRVRIGEAMRRSGLDEYKVGATYADVLDKLSGTKRGDGGVQKLLVDVLKECSRHLDSPQAGDRDARDASGPITLIHCVARPDRSAKQKLELPAEPAITVLEVKPAPEEAP
ncbi:MAG: hypothetical protein ACRD59_12575 [Candidatus Acidiferrales bacterium]